MMGGTLLSSGLGLVAVLALVGLNGFFVAAEFALVSVRTSRIDQLANEGRAGARRVQAALRHLDTYIAATQLGITMASLGLGFVAEPSIARLLEPLFARLPFLHGEGALLSAEVVAFALAFALATALHIVLGELAPKSVALQCADATALWVTGPLDLFLAVFRPFIHALNGVGNAVVRLIGLQPATEHGGVHSVEELELLVRSSREAGLLAEQQERMVAGVFDFGERRAGRVMTPRTELDAVPATIGLDALAARADAGKHSRLPVYDGDLDHVVGVVHAKDVLHLLRRGEAEESSFDVRRLLRPAPFVPASLPLDDLMAELRRHRTHLAIVVDEFGGTAGLVTLEDLLEEIVGAVADEYAPAAAAVAAQADGSVLLDGLLAVEEVEERFGLGLAEAYYATLGGYVFGQLGRVPAVGDEVATPGGRVLRVVELDGLRVARVQLLPPRHEVPRAGPLAIGLLALVAARVWAEAIGPARLGG